MNGKKMKGRRDSDRRACRRTDGGDEVDDHEGVEDRDDGRADGRDNVAQALEAAKEAEDSEGSQHLEQGGSQG